LSETQAEDLVPNINMTLTRKKQYKVFKFIKKIRALWTGKMQPC